LRRYASLGHLKELPIDKVKIDRSFIQDLPLNRDSAAITRAIIQMAHSLDITVIAEGVENETQARFLSQLGCDELQGAWVGAPLPRPQFEAWVALRQGLRASSSVAASSPAASSGAPVRR
jgi:EAL domain-containing protein (putative c-di-GMP-specific phosphodiesterase class I)